MSISEYFRLFLEVYIGFRFFFRILKIASDFQKNKEIRKNRELHYTIFIGNFGTFSEYFSEIRNFSERGCERKQLETGVKETAEENNARVAKEAA